MYLSSTSSVAAAAQDSRNWRIMLLCCSKPWIALAIAVSIARMVGGLSRAITSVPPRSILTIWLRLSPDRRARSAWVNPAFLRISLNCFESIIAYSVFI